MKSSLLVNLGSDRAAGPIAGDSFENSVQTDFRHHQAGVKPMASKEPQIGTLNWHGFIKETEIADLRGFGLSFLPRAMDLVRTLLQESLTPMVATTFAFVSGFSLNDTQIVL